MLEARNPSKKDAPKPEYTKCNAGHELKLHYNPQYNMNVWDCMICYQKMETKRLFINNRTSAFSHLIKAVEALRDDEETKDVRTAINKARNDLHRLGIYHEA